LTVGKHTFDEADWYTPVELVSAADGLNIESIWEHALDFKQKMGADYIMKRRQEQIQRSLWNYLGDALMKKLRH